MTEERWDPVREPWRVTIVLRGARFPHGWLDHVTTFATEEEARAKFNAPLPPYGSEAIIDFAEHADEWAARGRWRRVTRRKRQITKQRKP